MYRWPYLHGEKILVAESQNFDERRRWSIDQHDRDLLSNPFPDLVCFPHALGDEGVELVF